MRRGILIALIVLAGVGYGLSAFAQAEQSPECEQEIEEMIDVMTSTLTQLENSDGDAIGHMIGLRHLLTYAISNCMGLSFSSLDEGLETVIGPIRFEAGTYIARLTTDGPLNAEMEILSGECNGGAADLFSVEEFEALRDVEFVLDSQGCEALITISAAVEEWLLNFELIGESGEASSQGQTINKTLYATGTANLRSCAGTQCGVVATLNAGAEIVALEEVTGQAVNAGNALWYRLDYNGTEAYVYSGVVGDQQPIVTTGGGGNNVTSPATVVAPASPVPVVVTSPFGCNGIDDLNCSDFAAIGQNANAHLAACGDEDKLDRDGDGRACES